MSSSAQILATETVDPAAAPTTPTAGVPDVLALENQVCFALAVAARGVIGLYRPILEPLGLTHPQYLVMLALWERSPRTVRDLGDALQLEPATLSPLLKRLEAQGYIARDRNPADERALNITLTDAGARLREQALGVPPQVVARLGVELDELERLRSQLTDVIAAVRTTR
ncbi:MULTISPECIES: MarR family winged helix-turn-helix transcriptional regulator [unclassified Leifsonia]|uniref:MarR family winged helix-turn-helix transcriptional regulator n=1 Tax=unclassified Leifsonia TaxID=2663824 RepID=UPI0009E965CA|nr:MULTISPECIES: MarR family transcriptional regulator [unclassified Leifsonia]